MSTKERLEKVTDAFNAVMGNINNNVSDVLTASLDSKDRWQSAGRVLGSLLFRDSKYQIEEFADAKSEKQLEDMVYKYFQKMVGKCFTVVEAFVPASQIKANKDLVGQLVWEEKELMWRELAKAIS